MEKYIQYVKEKYGREILENDDGFIEYELFDDNSIYIYTLFTTKESRDKGNGKGLEQVLIDKYKPHTIMCDIDKGSNQWILALVQICKKADYKVYSDTEHKVILYKELSYEE